MNKREFLEKLDDLLHEIKESERAKTILYYDEMISDKIDDGFSEEEAVASLDDVSEIAAALLAELPLATLIQSKVKQSHENSSNKTLWVILAICGFPIWLPLAISFLAVILSVYISVWAVVISLFAAELALIISGVSAVVLGGWNIFRGQAVSGFALMSMGIAAIGLFILSVKPLLWLSKQFIDLSAAFLKKIKRLFISKEGV